MKKDTIMIKTETTKEITIPKALVFEFVEKIIRTKLEKTKGYNVNMDSSYNIRVWWKN